jgi:glutaredoxin 2
VRKSNIGLSCRKVIEWRRNKETIAGNFPELLEDTNSQIQKVQKKDKIDD